MFCIGKQEINKMTALNTSELLFEEKTLYQPPLEELKQGKNSWKQREIAYLISCFNCENNKQKEL